MGTHLIGAPEVGDELVTALVERIEYWDAKDVELSFALRRIMQRWQGAAINSLLLRDLKNGKSETGAVVKLLSLRRELREKQSNEIFDARRGSALALGISTCLLEDGGEYDTLLTSDNLEAKTAMFACARLIRAGLPVQKVAENLRHPNQTLALAAERYLESEDSPEARRAVLSLHPNKAKILGATTHFAAGDSFVTSDYLEELFASVNKSPFHGFSPRKFPEITTNEKRLQKEVLENPKMLGVYSFNGNFLYAFTRTKPFSVGRKTRRATVSARWTTRNLTASRAI